MVDIVKYPSDTLRHISKEIKFPISQEDRSLLDKLFSYVKNNSENAVGLSAVQIGVLKRACAILYKGQAYKLVNPKIIGHSTEKEFAPEGCLSVDEHKEGNVGRWKSVRVYAYDLIANKYVVINATGFLARILQHEIDHMDGTLYIDYLK